MTKIAQDNTACAHGFILASCADCGLKALCLPIAIDIKDLDKLNKIIKRERPIHPGDHLYRVGEPFSSIYAVRSGSIKTYLINDDGVEQVTGFYLPGEIVGFDGVASGTHACNVMALETSSVCEIPFNQMKELSRQVPVLQQHMFQIMGRQIEFDHQMMLTLSKKNAEGRIATFLLSLSQRNGRRRLSPNAMHLPMSRTDIGNFLGLTIETVSRTFSRLQKDDILDVDHREVIIKDHERLRELTHIRS